MIAYDDLVSALQGWRGKQGLPASGAVTPGASSGASAGSGPARTAPPVAPPPRAPSVVESLDDADYVEDAPVEEAYEAAADGEVEAEAQADELAYVADDDVVGSEIEPTAIGAIPGAPEIDEEQPAPRAAADQADW